MKKINVKNVLIVLRPSVVADFQGVLPNIVTWLKKKKKSVLFFASEKNRLEAVYKGKELNYELLDDEDDFESIDLIISLGGDGTLLGISRKVAGRGVPIMGVNMGKLGFITEFSVNDFFDSLDTFFSDGFNLYQINLFSVEIFLRNKAILKSFFINDAVVAKKDIARMFSLKVDVKDQHVYNLPGDGLIVSSPIGSTAYSLAAGGPIINTDVNALVLTPICPHSLTHRPIVVSDKVGIAIKPLEKTNDLTLTLDGQEVIPFSKKHTIVINRIKSKKVHLIKNLNKEYFYNLREKLTHGR